MGKKRLSFLSRHFNYTPIEMIRMPEQASCKLLENLLDGDREGSEAISDAEGTLRDLSRLTVTVADLTLFVAEIRG
jgi:hypothetical protein